MADRFSRLFAEYAVRVRWEDLSAETVHEVKRRLLDTIGVALAAFHEDAPRAVRAYAQQFRLHEKGATLWGTREQTTPEIAGLANGTLVRYLDFNDAYISREPVHPSDTIAPLWALAEWLGLPPRDLLTAVAVAYEIAISLCDAGEMRRRGWDHVNYITIATAAAAGRLLGLSAEGVAQAIALAVVPHAAMRQTRVGELSMWKAAAAANAGRHGVFGALLAAQGMSGPFQPFVGEMGFIRHLLGGEPFAEEPLAPLAAGRPPMRILESHLKYWPVEGNTQGAVAAALLLHRVVGDPDTIEAVRIDTFQTAYEITARDPEKWAPQTRETADHSLPYVVAVALLDGRVDRSSFARKRLGDPRIMSLIQRTRVEVDPQFNLLFPKGGYPGRVIVRTRAGEEYAEEVHAPKGHAANPMSDSEIVEKFRTNVAGLLSEEQMRRLEEAIWGFERLESLEQLVPWMEVRREG